MPEVIEKGIILLKVESQCSCGKTFIMIHDEKISDFIFGRCSCGKEWVANQKIPSIDLYENKPATFRKEE